MLGLETPVERLQHMNQPAYEFYLNRNPGIDLAADRLEIGVCAQHNNGGIDVDLWWRSSIAGLFPVGEAAGAHGVARCCPQLGPGRGNEGSPVDRGPRAGCCSR